MLVVCSLLATCRNHDVNPRDYLNDVISLPYHTKASHEELLQLLPHKWKLTHSESIMTKTHDIGITYRYKKNTTAATTNEVIAAVVIIYRYNDL